MLSKRYILYCHKSQKMLLKFVCMIISHNKEAAGNDGAAENAVINITIKFLSS